MNNSAINKSRAWQRMLSGARLDLLEPSPEDVNILDIAHGLARVARWNGQTIGKHAYSVAQHSLLVESIFRKYCKQNNIITTPQELMAALLHDAPEYVIGDMISPFKAVLGGNYGKVEDRLQGAIHLRFNLPEKITPELKALIKKADLIAAFHEATELAGFSMEEANQYFAHEEFKVSNKKWMKPWSTHKAQRKFIERFYKLIAR
jgi:5'-deoxynucleotidase YfbR-like HD superfamily hydrolase